MKIHIALFLSLNILASMAFAFNPEHVEIFKQTQTCEGCDFNVLNAKPEALGRSDFSNSVLSGSYFYGSVFEDLDLRKLKAREINAVSLTFHNSDLSEADFSYSDISKLKITRWTRGDQINFTGAYLTGSDFSFTEFKAPDFYQAYMKNVSLYKVIWPQANLSGAVLQSADLTYAKLQYANLTEANLTAAVLSHADLSYANLLNAKINEDQLKTTSSLCGAILPNGSLGSCK